MQTLLKLHPSCLQVALHNRTKNRIKVRLQKCEPSLNANVILIIQHHCCDLPILEGIFLFIFRRIFICIARHINTNGTFIYLFFIFFYIFFSLEKVWILSVETCVARSEPQELIVSSTGLSAGHRLLLTPRAFSTRGWRDLSEPLSQLPFPCILNWHPVLRLLSIFLYRGLIHPHLLLP